MRTESSNNNEEKKGMDSPTSPLDESSLSTTDAAQYLIKDLKQLQGTAIFEKLDFTNCPDTYVERLFVAAPQDSYLPPRSFRQSASKILEWTSMSVDAQEVFFMEKALQPTGRFKRTARRTSTNKKFADATEPQEDAASLTNMSEPVVKEKRKIKKKDKNDKSPDQDQPVRKKPRKPKKLPTSAPDELLDQPINALTGNELVNQERANDLLRSEQYSANGSIVYSDDEGEDDDDDLPLYQGRPIALDPKTLQQVSRLYMSNGKRGLVKPSETEAMNDKNTTSTATTASSQDDSEKRASRTYRGATPKQAATNHSRLSIDSLNDDDDLYNGASIFGQTQGQNATWVSCDKCGKWRRLRGVVDEKKLPQRWFCSMNKGDPTRAKCSAPEENYDEGQPITPESAADAKARKHFRVWSRRIKTQEAYEARQPPMTRGKKRQVAGSKEPYEWVRCCNPSCGKWRALLRVMGAKSHVIDRSLNGEWYCSMNNWDEKLASCGAPQENLPAVGCPSWVQQDNN